MVLVRRRSKQLLGDSSGSPGQLPCNSESPRTPHKPMDATCSATSLGTTPSTACSPETPHRGRDGTRKAHSMQSSPSSSSSCSRSSFAHGRGRFRHIDHSLRESSSSEEIVPCTERENHRAALNLDQLPRSTCRAMCQIRGFVLSPLRAEQFKPWAEDVQEITGRCTTGWRSASRSSSRPRIRNLMLGPLRLEKAQPAPERGCLPPPIAGWLGPDLLQGSAGSVSSGGDSDVTSNRVSRLPLRPSSKGSVVGRWQVGLRRGALQDALSGLDLSPE